MESLKEKIEREASELAKSMCIGCQKKSKNYDEHNICMSMKAWSYCYDIVSADYDESSANRNVAKKAKYDQ